MAKNERIHEVFKQTDNFTIGLPLKRKKNITTVYSFETKTTTVSEATVTKHSNLNGVSTN